MKSTTVPGNPSSRRALVIASAAAVAAAFLVALPGAARAEDVRPPAVPEDLKLDPGFEPFFVGHATGTQNYICLPRPTGFGYVLFTPEATLFSENGSQRTTHFFSPNPFEPNTNPALAAIGTIRATWQHSRDSSTVWAQVALAKHASTDANFVAANSVAWLKLTVVGAEAGPTGGGTLADTKFIHRVNTHGGVAPATGCSSSDDVGHLAFVPYTADYFFYRAAPGQSDQDD